MEKVVQFYYTCLVTSDLHGSILLQQGFRTREFHHTFLQALGYQSRPIIALQPKVSDHLMGESQFLRYKLLPILPLLLCAASLPLKKESFCPFRYNVGPEKNGSLL
jgi:hypothetical protein